MELYLVLLKALLRKEHYRLYREGLDTSFIETNFPELGKILHTIDSLQKRENKDYGLTELKLAFFTLYPRAVPKAYEGLFQAISSTDADESVVAGYLRNATERRVAFNLAQRALHVADGREEVGGLVDFIKKVPELLEEKTVIGESEDDFVSDDLEALYQSRVNVPGLRWRLGSFNSTLGSLRQGNFGFLYARPEAGKSTLLASEGTYMAEQADGYCLWFDNEEEGKDVQIRVYQAALNMTKEELFGDRVANLEKYKSLLQGKLRISSGIVSKQYVEKMCHKWNPKLIMINQLDKVQGFSGDRHDLLLKAIYQWARELSKEYGPVIGVSQAGGTGEDKRYLTMNDVDSSHTAKQGEADWILGIGQAHEPGHEYIRYFHLSKNKLIGDSDTDPTMRHGKWSARLIPERARYADFD